MDFFHAENQQLIMQKNVTSRGLPSEHQSKQLSTLPHSLESPLSQNPYYIVHTSPSIGGFSNGNMKSFKIRVNCKDYELFREGKKDY